MTKKELRVKYKELRVSLSEDEIAGKSMAVANRLLPLPIWEKKYFHIFLPITEMKEIDTEYILHILSGKDKDIIVSKSDFETRTMTPILLTDNTIIKKNQYGIPEPEEGIEIPPTKIEVVFVPLLAFDLAGNRVGYGKGFYDKFLAHCKKDVIKIGLSFFEAEEMCGEVFESDVKLDYCVTPALVYAF